MLMQAWGALAAGLLQEAMSRGEYWRLVDSQGRPPGLLGMWPSRAITFIEARPHRSATQGRCCVGYGSGGSCCAASALAA